MIRNRAIALGWLIAALVVNGVATWTVPRAGMVTVPIALFMTWHYWRVLHQPTVTVGPDVSLAGLGIRVDDDSRRWQACRFNSGPHPATKAKSAPASVWAHEGA